MGTSSDPLGPPEWQLTVTQREELATTVSDLFFAVADTQLHDSGRFSVVLTGGTLGIETLRQIAQNPRARDLDWSGVYLWWGDERFVQTGNPERNEVQAQDVFLSRVPIPAHNIFRFPASDETTLDKAAAKYRDLLRSQAAPGEEWPTFDVAFAGMGPDAHVLSVFPGLDATQADSPDILGVRNSPKPPPERLTMTIPLLNRAERVWLVAAGAEKADALRKGLSGAPIGEAPVAGIRGAWETRIFIDQELANAIPVSPPSVS